jgi:hypothetical protein
MTTETAAGFHPLRARLRARLIEAAVLKGFSEADAAEAVHRAMPRGEHPAFEWLLGGGFAKIIEAVLLLLQIFGTPRSEQEAEG